MEDPNFRNRQQTSEGPVSASHFLYTYLNFMKCQKTVERNMVMLKGMKVALDKGSVEANKKPIKAQDLVRVYETIIQNLNELPQLAGLEEDLEFKHEVEAKVGFFKAWR